MTNKNRLRLHVEAGYRRAALDPSLRPFVAHLDEVREKIRFAKRWRRLSEDRAIPFTAAYWAGVFAAMAEQVKLCSDKS